MTDRPIIFSAPMVRALLAGRKSQTRRLLKPKYGNSHLQCDPYGKWWWWTPSSRKPHIIQPIRFEAGDRLCVREAMRWTDNLVYDADREAIPVDRMPPDYTAGRAHISGMFMPRWASRLTLLVTDVRVQRLQDITNPDAVAEGGDVIEAGMHMEMGTPRRWFADLWESLHGAGSWDQNPMVVAVSFENQKRNIDEVIK